MAVNLKEKSFTIRVTVEVSQEEYAGVFKCKPALSHSQQLLKDKLRREYLGDKASEASPRAQNAAEIFSSLNLHLTDAPRWWTEANNGMDLLDDNVVGAVYGETVKKINEFYDEIQAKAAAAKKELEAAAPTTAP